MKHIDIINQSKTKEIYWYYKTKGFLTKVYNTELLNLWISNFQLTFKKDSLDLFK